MKLFKFKSDQFELTLEDCETAVETFQAVVSALKDLPTTNTSKAPKPEVSTTPNVETKTGSHIHIDEFFAENKPSKLRDILEGTVEYLVACKGLAEFTKDQVYDEAKKSLHYEASWTKNRATTFDRMTKDGFIAKRPEGKYVMKAK